MNRKKLITFFLVAAVTASTAVTSVPVGAFAPLMVQAEETSNVYEQLKASFTASLQESVKTETENMTPVEMLILGKKYEAGDGVTLWYAKAMAIYEHACSVAEEGEVKTEIQNAIDALNQYKENVLAEGVQGAVFSYYREGVTASQQGNYAKTYCVYYDDAFFFEEPENRGIGGLGDLLRDGVDGIVTQDIDKAVAVYKYCAENLGKGNGYTALGLLYSAEDGTYPGITHSDEKAMEYFKKSFDESACTSIDFKGPRYAGNLYDSGYTLDDGSVIAPDYAKAEACYLIAVKGNGRTFDGTAAYQLGVYYEEGRPGVEKDMVKAVQYYQKALSDRNVHYTMLGIPQCLLTLGRCYENGEGIDKDLAVAREYYQKAYDAAVENLSLAHTGADNTDMLKVKEETELGLARLQEQGQNEEKQPDNNGGTLENKESDDKQPSVENTSESNTNGNNQISGNISSGVTEIVAANGTETNEAEPGIAETVSPKTGEDRNIIVWSGISCLALAFVMLLRRLKTHR